MDPSRTPPKIATIVVAAGQSRRFGAATHKLFAPLAGKPLIIRTLEMVARWPLCGRIVLVINAAHRDSFAAMRAQLEGLGVTDVVDGGHERQDSVRNGLNVLAGGDQEVILVHDAARPFPGAHHIAPLCAAALHHGAAILAVPVADTLKRVAADVVVGTVDRTGLWQSQTPQAFRSDVLRQVMRASSEGLATDEAALCEQAGVTVSVIPGDRVNLKITTLADLELADALFAHATRSTS